MESFDRFQLAGLALICLKHESKADAKRDLSDLISAAQMWQRRRVPKGDCVTWNLRDKAHRMELAKYSLEGVGALSGMDIKQ